MTSSRTIVVAFVGVVLCALLAVLVWPQDRAAPAAAVVPPRSEAPPAEEPCVELESRVVAFDRLVALAPLSAGSVGPQRMLAQRARELVSRHVQEQARTAACGEVRRIPTPAFDALMDEIVRNIVAAGDERAAEEVRAWKAEGHDLLEGR